MKKPNFEMFRCTNDLTKTWTPVRIAFSSNSTYPNMLRIANIYRKDSTGTVLNLDAFIANEDVPDFSIYKKSKDGFVKMSMKVLRDRESSQLLLQNTFRRMSISQFNALYQRELTSVHLENTDFTAIREHHRPSRLKFYPAPIPTLNFPPASSKSSSYFVPIDLYTGENFSLNAIFIKSSDIISSIPIVSEGFATRQLSEPLPSMHPELQKAATGYIAESEVVRRKLAILAISNSELELSDLAHAPQGKSEPETLLRSAIKGKSPSPQRKISPRVHWNPLPPVPETEDSSSPASGSLQRLRRTISPSFAQSTWKLCYIACVAPLGKWGMLVVLFGLIGVTLATQGTVVFYGAASMIGYRRGCFRNQYIQA